MLEQITSFTQHFGILVPIIVGLVHVARKAGLSAKYAPIVSVLLGVASGYIYIFPNTSGVLFGVVAGLSACGLWSGVKSTVK